MLASPRKRQRKKLSPFVIKCSKYRQSSVIVFMCGRSMEWSPTGEITDPWRHLENDIPVA